MSHQQLICHVQGSLCGVFCLLLVASENARSKTKQNQHKNNVTFKLMFWSFFLQGTTHRSQASSSTHLRLACRLQLRPSNLMTLIHSCFQSCLQFFMLWGCFKHICCCHYFFGYEHRERKLEHETSVETTKLCQWHLGLRFCGCSNMSILGSF